MLKALSLLLFLLMAAPLWPEGSDSCDGKLAAQGRSTLHYSISRESRKRILHLQWIPSLPLARRLYRYKAQPARVHEGEIGEVFYRRIEMEKLLEKLHGSYDRIRIRWDARDLFSWRDLEDVAAKDSLLLGLRSSLDLADTWIGAFLTELGFRYETEAYNFPEELAGESEIRYPLSSVRFYNFHVSAVFFRRGR
jgi:hypothetical protein